MHEILKHLLFGVGSIILAPAGMLPPAQLRITLPPQNATDALAHDFSMIGKDLNVAIDKVKYAEQIELDLV